MKILYLKKILFLIVIQKVICVEIKVRVEQGWLAGEVLDLFTKDGHYYSFKGIPYAQAPTGTLRFKAPQPPRRWEGIRNATVDGSKCPQVDIFANGGISENEDCLFLNVFSPNLKPNVLLSVLVFIHGGGFKSGSSDSNTFGPDFIVRKNMVLVTFNYRLDALGFLCLGTRDVPGNAGLKDQVAALKWVQKNIKHFGGDARKVTIMGQSAGGASVALHIASPMSEGLFQRAIAMSGTPYDDWAIPFYPERRAFVLGKQLGCETKDPEELLQFLQSLPASKLVNTNPSILSFEEFVINYVIKMYHFTPVIEHYFGSDNFLAYDIYKEIAHVNKVEVMFGHTNEEALPIIDAIATTYKKKYDRFPELYVPRKILNHFAPSTVLKLSDEIRKYYFGNKSDDLNTTTYQFATYVNDVTFLYDDIKYYLKMPTITNTARYAYQFSMTSGRNLFATQGEKYGISGAGHSDDLMYLFNPKFFESILNLNSVEFQLIDMATTIFTDFAKYGNPTHSSAFGITWPLFNSETMQYVDIGTNLTVLSFKDKDSFRFWNKMYASLRL